MWSGLMSMAGSAMEGGDAQGLMGRGNVQAVDPQTALDQTNAGAQIQQVPMWMGGQAPQMPTQPLERQHMASAGMSGLAPMQQQQMAPPQMAPPQTQQPNPNDWYQRDLQEFIRQDMMPRGIM